MWKHVAMDNKEDDTIQFEFRVVRTFQSTMEAIRIRRVGEQNVLNSLVPAYNRCSLSRLVIQHNNKIIEGTYTIDKSKE